MDLYTKVSSDISRLLTTRYSSSFTASSLLFAKQLRPHIYNIYGLVRIADEIVDTYTGPDKQSQLDDLEQEVYTSLTRQYSTNPIVHSFALTASRYDIDASLIKPFFDSMRTDIDPPETFTQDQYSRYIYGSAEVVGLMCLRVFVSGDEAAYEDLSDGARHLGAAYQKVNFLRDIADDYQRLSRVYFPNVRFESFDDQTKQAIEQDIDNDFRLALPAIMRLPSSSRRAVLASYQVYYQLLDELKQASADTIKQRRVRVSAPVKLAIIGRSLLRSGP